MCATVFVGRPLALESGGRTVGAVASIATRCVALDRGFFRHGSTFSSPEEKRAVIDRAHKRKEGANNDGKGRVYRPRSDGLSHGRASRQTGRARTDGLQSDNGESGKMGGAARRPGHADSEGCG